MVGSVADSVKDIIRHNGRAAKISDRKWAIKIYVGLLPPVLEPLSKFLVVFVGSVVLYIRLARPSFWLWVWDLRHFFEFFQTSQQIPGYRGEQRGQGSSTMSSQSRIPVERHRVLNVRTKRGHLPRTTDSLTLCVDDVVEDLVEGPLPRANWIWFVRSLTVGWDPGKSCRIPCGIRAGSRQSPASINGTLEKVFDEERLLRLQKTKEGEALSPPVSKGGPACANAYSQIQARRSRSETIA